jgi:hypothetical protein
MWSIWLWLVGVVGVKIILLPLVVAVAVACLQDFLV